MIGNAPIRDPFAENGYISASWANWFTRASNILFGLSQSGLTADRPTVGLWIGRMYFDTDLNIPIWYDANGSTGWCDATGMAV